VAVTDGANGVGKSGVGVEMLVLGEVAEDALVSGGLNG
jgi:hypothetical protein